MRRAKDLIKDILEIRRMSVREFASGIKVRHSTVCRILSGKTEEPSLRTYMKILEFKGKIMNDTALERRGI